MGRKKQISDQRRLYTERMRLQKGVFSSLSNAAGHIGELYADFVQSDEVIIMAKGVSAEAREDILVQAFLTCPNISEISKKTKIPRPTIYTVIHSDSFQRKYSEARNEAVTGAIAYLQGKLGECAAVLVNTAIDTEVPAQIRVNAANAALSQCSQWTKNVDMIERLETMEELMSRVEQEQKSQKRGK